MLVYIAEYQNRRTLAEMGYRFDPMKLSARKAAIFTTIASEYSDISEKKAEANSGG